MKICQTCNGQFDEGIAYCPKDGSRLTSASKMALAGKTVPDRPNPPGSGDSAAAPSVVAHDAEPDLMGRTIAQRYQILRRLGEGGMGVVYAAVDTRLEKQVAIKVLREDFARRSDVVARFTQEAKSAARIKHENVLDVTDYGQTEDGSFYIAMELLVGTDLADVLQQNRTVESQRAIAITVQVCRALGAAHGKGIVHRDLKPENVFLVTADDGREVVKIVDFGIAQMKDLSGGGSESSRKLTRTGMIFGTPEYMSPEQAAGKSIDHRVDIYATGVILYEMLAGRVPFVGDSFMGVLTQHMFEAVPPIQQMNPSAQVSRELEGVIFKALAKDANQRYDSMQELIDDLTAIRDGRAPVGMGTGAGAAMPMLGAPRATASSPVPVEYSVEASRPRSNRMLVGIAVVGALAAGGAAIALVALRPSAGNSQNNLSAGGRAATTNDAGSGTTAQNSSAADAAAAAGGTNMATADAATQTPGTPDAQTAVELLTVHVQTTGGTGRVEVEGQPENACERTPCNLRLARGVEVRLRASAPNKRGEQTFTPTEPGATVTIALRASGGGTNATVRNSGSGGRGGSRSRCSPGQTTFFNPATGLHEPCFLHN